jgi:hypothetical protein
MKNKLIIAAILTTLSGCSAYKAISQPPAADLSGIGVGTSRQDLISRLGSPKMIDTTQEGLKQDIFEFKSGAHQATKIRAVFYVAADVFTLGLAEIILWPLEMTAFDAASCTGMATYDEKFKVRTWMISDKHDTTQDC